MHVDPDHFRIRRVFHVDWITQPLEFALDIVLSATAQHQDHQEKIPHQTSFTGGNTPASRLAV
jgi:hypothetical protein